MPRVSDAPTYSKRVESMVHDNLWTCMLEMFDIVAVVVLHGEMILNSSNVSTWTVFVLKLGVEGMLQAILKNEIVM